MSTRREALVTLATAAALPVLKAEPAGPKYFSRDDFALLSKLVDAIIPRTDTPGAVDAGVPLYIDDIVSRAPKTAATIQQGLSRLRATGLETLPALEASSDPFFQLVKDLTVDGYYSSREGLVTELGYHGNTFLRGFPGCTHPEHQAATDAN